MWKRKASQALEIFAPERELFVGDLWIPQNNRAPAFESKVNVAYNSRSDIFWLISELGRSLYDSRQLCAHFSKAREKCWES